MTDVRRLALMIGVWLFAAVLNAAEPPAGKVFSGKVALKTPKKLGISDRVRRTPRRSRSSFRTRSR